MTSAPPTRTGSISRSTRTRTASRSRGAYCKSALAVFVVAFVSLAYLGPESTSVWGQFGFDAFFLDTKDRATWLARLCTVVYFLFFILMPWYTARDEVRPVPERVKH